MLGATGQPFANQRVELQRPASAGQGRLVAVTDAEGHFEYRGLAPGRYEAELRLGDRVVATSGPIELSAGAMQVSALTLALPNVKVFLESLGVGTKARVSLELRDGTRVNGYIREIDEASFTVADSNALRTTTIAYDDVRQAKKGRSELKKFLIFTGAVFGILATVSVIGAIALAGAS